MYTLEQRRRVVELYALYQSTRKVIEVLGYPSSAQTVARWSQEFINSGSPGTIHSAYCRYTAEEKQVAIDYYIQKGESFDRTCKALGYPTPRILRRWVDQAYPNRKKRQNKGKRHCISNARRVKYPQELKERAVIDICAGRKTVSEVAREYGLTPGGVSQWKKNLLSEEQYLAMKYNNAKKKCRSLSDEFVAEAMNSPSAVVESVISQDAYVEELKANIRALEMSEMTLEAKYKRLQMEYDLLQQAAELIKKGLGINLEDLRTLKNYEKTQVIDALREKYGLKVLLQELDMGKSSYFYQKSIQGKDKYASLRETIIDIFLENDRRYGYRRINLALRKRNIVVSPKVVRRIMFEEGLEAIYPKERRHYTSYLGEISPAVPNLLERNFHAAAPAVKWLTDITEFVLPKGKVYLSAMVDCFDGLVVAWTIGTSPNAKLVNTMLDKAICSLKEGEKPIIHSDRGCHYRWPGWIQRMETAGLQRSMSKKGFSPDNAACEGFFGRMKNEFYYCKEWHDTPPSFFMMELEQYLQWYNESRIKESLGGRSPVEYRRSLGLVA